MAAGPLILLLFTETTPLVWLAVPYLIFGAGYRMLNAPINNTQFPTCRTTRPGSPRP